MKIGAVLGGVVKGFNDQRAANQAAQENDYKLQQEHLHQQYLDAVAKAGKTGPQVGDPTGPADDSALPSVTPQEMSDHYLGPGKTAPDFTAPNAPSPDSWAGDVSQQWQANQQPTPSGAPAPGSAAPAGIDTSGPTSTPPAAPPTPAGVSFAASPGAPSSPPTQAPTTAPSTLDGKQVFNDWFVPAEGHINPSDTNGRMDVYGLNQAYNPQVNANTTKAQAAQIWDANYWRKSGADKMSPALAVIHADTYSLNPAWADSALKQSGGDPVKYMQLREQDMQRDVKANPTTVGKYAGAWANRNQKLWAYAQKVSSPDNVNASAPPPGSPGSAPGVPTASGDGQLVYMPGYGPAVQSNNQTMSGAPGGPRLTFATDPSQYTPYKAPNGQTMFTTSPKTYSQDDADAAQLQLARQYGQTDEVERLENGMLQRQEGRLKIQSDQRAAERDTALQTIGQATSPYQIAGIHNSFHPNGMFAAVQQSPDGSHITAYQYDNATRQPVAVGDWHSIVDPKTGQTVVSALDQMKGSLTAGVSNDYNAYLKSSLDALGSFRQAHAVAANQEAEAAKTSAYVGAGGPQAEVANTQAQAGAYGASAQAAQAEAANKAVDTQKKQFDNQVAEDAQKTLMDPNSTPQQRGLAINALNVQGNNLGIKLNPAPITIAGQMLISGVDQHGQTVVLDPVQPGAMIPIGTNQHFNIEALDKDPDWGAGRITLQPDPSTGQYYYRVMVNGAPQNEGYTTFNEAKAQVAKLTPKAPNDGRFRLFGIPIGGAPDTSVPPATPAAGIPSNTGIGPWQVPGH